MAEVLVLVEHADGAVKKITAELITAARKLGEPSAVVVGKPGTAAPLLSKTVPVMAPRLVWASIGKGRDSKSRNNNARPAFRKIPTSNLP